MNNPPNAALDAPARRVVVATTGATIGTAKLIGRSVLAFSLTDLVKILLFWPLILWVFFTQAPFVSAGVKKIVQIGGTYDAFFDHHIGDPVRCAVINKSPFVSTAKRAYACSNHKPALGMWGEFLCSTNLSSPANFDFDCAKAHGYDAPK